MGPGLRRDDAEDGSHSTRATARPVILRSGVSRVSKDRRPPAGPCILRGSLRSHLRMTGENMSPHSRDMICPSFAISFRPLFKTEGAGNAGYMLHPRSRAQG